ncbi:AraC-like ligand-binding domain-containing protein [Kitasatospora azatica]|uniref:AraC-like ligand-binding domain-containing protein n=1 Tax=Kitasatospora azatica TaxID=58347 RepID=UPI0007C74A12|nr:helix-turn-helix domain-containing protein [Kitasatospora azatica]
MWHSASAAELPASDRFDWFVETVSNTLMPSAFNPQDAGGFYAEGALLDLGPAQMSRFSYSPLRSRRTPALIRRGDPEQYQLGLVTRGSAWYAQAGREARLGAGDMVLWDTSRPYESGSGLDGSEVEALVLQIPKARLPLPSQQVDRLLARRLDSRTGLGAVLAQFLVSVSGNGPDCRPQDLPGLGNMAVELTASCVLQQLGAGTRTPAQARSQALLGRIDAFVEQNLADPDLTPRLIADRHHISLRHLYALFEERPEGVAATIRRRRLERCRTDLARPDLRGQAIHAIAARWGFPSASVFSRIFRAAYDTTPKDYRQDALTRAQLYGHDAHRRPVQGDRAAVGVAAPTARSGAWR